MAGQSVVPHLVFCDWLEHNALRVWFRLGLTLISAIIHHGLDYLNRLHQRLSDGAVTNCIRSPLECGRLSGPQLFH